MKNVFGDSSSSDSEDLPVKKVRKVAHLGLRQKPKKSDADEDSDLDAQLDSITKSYESENKDSQETDKSIPEKASVSKSIMNPDSVAFKMMQMMGYKIGETLGSGENKSAIYEPITSIKIKGRAGVGAATTSVISDPELTFTEKNISVYRGDESQKHRERRNRRTIAKLQEFCFRVSGDEELLMNGDLVLDDVNELWRDYATTLQNKIKTTHDPEVLSSEPLDAEKALRSLIDYCRANFCYCPYCEVQYNDAEDMDGHCPGIDPDIH